MLLFGTVVEEDRSHYSFKMYFGWSHRRSLFETLYGVLIEWKILQSRSILSGLKDNILVNGHLDLTRCIFCSVLQSWLFISIHIFSLHQQDKLNMLLWCHCGFQACNEVCKAFMSLSSLRFLLLISPGLAERPLVVAVVDVSFPLPGRFWLVSFFNLLN